MRFTCDAYAVIGIQIKEKRVLNVHTALGKSLVPTALLTAVGPHLIFAISIPPYSSCRFSPTETAGSSETTAPTWQITSSHIAAFYCHVQTPDAVDWFIVAAWRAIRQLWRQTGIPKTTSHVRTYISTHSSIWRLEAGWTLRRWTLETRITYSCRCFLPRMQICLQTLLTCLQQPPPPPSKRRVNCKHSPL
jgi:hypothetical protein